jgi:hypothetical protein
MIIVSLNTHFLKVAIKKNFNLPNLLTSHILCLGETKIENIIANKELHNTLSKKCQHFIFLWLKCHNDALLQNKFKFKIASYNKLWCKITTFNENTHDTLHIITIHKSLKMQIGLLYFHFKKLLPGAIRTHDRFATAPLLRTRSATTRRGRERERERNEAREHQRRWGRSGCCTSGCATAATPS